MTKTAVNVTFRVIGVGAPHMIQKPSPKTDVAISVYGKPYSTALTLASLLAHSGSLIDRIYFLEEPRHPYGDQVESVLHAFRDREFIHFKIPLYLGYSPSKKQQITNRSYRESIRYQYAWERTDKKFLFITHNDCLYTGNIIGGMLERLSDETYAGVGLIGQCWNCPANFAELCCRENYEQFKPSYAEAVNIIESHWSPRTRVDDIDRKFPMPFPECRLNEFACLINVALLRDQVAPRGDVEPFGAIGLDIGADWFRKLILRGYRFLNWYEGVLHAPFNGETNGHVADSDRQAYEKIESAAREYLRDVYPAVFGRMANYEGARKQLTAHSQCP